MPGCRISLKMEIVDNDLSKVKVGVIGGVGQGSSIHVLPGGRG